MQVRNAFDAVTIKKIMRGAVYAMAVPAVIGLLEYLGTLQINSPALAIIVAYLVPIAINVIKEYRAGVELNQ